MFYLREFFTRVKYFIFSLITTFFILYFFKDVLLIVVIYTLFSQKEDIFISFSIDHFIYTHPTELFSMYITLVSVFSFFYLLPYILWQIIDFFKQSLYIQEYTFLKRLFAFFF